MGDRPDTADIPDSPAPSAAINEILPAEDPASVAAGPQPASQTLALVKRLARSHPPSADLQALLEGPLRDAVAAAAGYAGDAISDATRNAYLRDWAEFSTWCRTNGADPNELPVNPVLVAA